jgi:hypothetical protein
MNAKIKPFKLPNILLFKNENFYRKNNMNEYFLNSMKNLKIKKENYQHNCSTENINKPRNLKTKLMSILNSSKYKTIDSKKQSRNDKNNKEVKVIPNFSFKNLYEIIKKNNLKKSASYTNITNKDNENIKYESNFMKLLRDSNIYTSNANYIKNKKMLIVDKYNYDNNRYKPDRIGLFDMSNFNNTKYKHKKTIYGHIYYNHNKYLPKSNENNFKY